MSLVTPDVVTDEVVVDENTAQMVDAVEKNFEKASEATTEVAVATEAKAPVATSTSGGSMQAFYEEQAEAGLEGLEIDAFSFDRIKLQDGEFIMVFSLEYILEANYKKLMKGRYPNGYSDDAANKREDKS